MCPNLVELDLTFGDELQVQADRMEGVEAELFSNLAVWPTYPKLTWLGLQVMAVKAEALLAYVQKHRATLEFLEMDSIWFGGQLDGWRPILETLVGAPALNVLSFSVSTEDDEVNIVDGYGEEVQGAIKKVLKEGPAPHSDDDLDDDLDGYGDGWMDEDDMDYDSDDDDMMGGGGYYHNPYTGSGHYGDLSWEYNYFGSSP